MLRVYCGLHDSSQTIPASPRNYRKLPALTRAMRLTPDNPVIPCCPVCHVCLMKQACGGEGQRRKGGPSVHRRRRRARPAGRVTLGLPDVLETDEAWGVVRCRGVAWKSVILGVSAGACACSSWFYSVFGTGRSGTQGLGVGSPVYSVPIWEVKGKRSDLKLGEWRGGNIRCRC